MSAYQVEMAPDAERDIREAFLWYLERNQLIADAFRTEVFDVIERVGMGPLGRAADALGNRYRVLQGSRTQSFTKWQTT